MTTKAAPPTPATRVAPRRIERANILGAAGEGPGAGRGGECVGGWSCSGDPNLPPTTTTEPPDLASSLRADLCLLLHRSLETARTTGLSSGIGGRAAPPLLLPPPLLTP
jgi:hypothetical protein